MVKFEVTLFCKLCIVNLETVMFVLKNAVCRYFPCPCDFFWSELDIHGFLITSDVLDSKPQGQNGNVDLLRMVFSTQRALSLPSKCCNWGMANHFNQGFLFLPSSLGLTRLEHGFVLSSRSSPFSAHVVSTTDALSGSHWLVPERPAEPLAHASVLCFENTQRDPKSAPALT